MYCIAYTKRTFIYFSQRLDRHQDLFVPHDQPFIKLLQLFTDDVNKSYMPVTVKPAGRKTFIAQRILEDCGLQDDFSKLASSWVETSIDYTSMVGLNITRFPHQMENLQEALQDFLVCELYLEISNL